MLVEVLPNGRIDLAISAFQGRFGLPQETRHGRSLREPGVEFGQGWLHGRPGLLPCR